MEKHDTAGRITYDDVTRRMRFAYWISEVSDAYPEYVILIDFPQQLWLYERVSALPHTYIASLVSDWARGGGP